MREITPALALDARKAVDEENKVGVQMGEPIGHSRPPRVYLAAISHPNAGMTSVVVNLFETGDNIDAYEFPESKHKAEDGDAIAKAADMIQEYIDQYPDDGDVPSLFFAGSDTLANKLKARLEIPEYVGISTDDPEPQYVP